jgi:nucleotide-binding universal stress UspA family protein
MSDAFETILVSTDFSDLANAAVPVAFRLARDHGARVVLAHVLEGLGTPNPLYAHYCPTPTPEQRASAEEHARASLAGLVPKQRGSAACEIVVRHGAAADELCRLAKERRASLLVIASHGRSGMGRFLLGSVAERVLHLAPCSVLVVRPAAPHG